MKPVVIPGFSSVIGIGGALLAFVLFSLATVLFAKAQFDNSPDERRSFMNPEPKPRFFLKLCEGLSLNCAATALLA